MKNPFYFLGNLCIVMELLGMSLYEMIKRNGFRGFPLPFVRRFLVRPRKAADFRFAVQLLESLVFLGSQGVVHCDLKPENIVTHPSENEIKVIDFGSSCFETRTGSAFNDDI